MAHIGRRTDRGGQRREGFRLVHRQWGTVASKDREVSACGVRPAHSRGARAAASPAYPLSWTAAVTDDFTPRPARDALVERPYRFATMNRRRNGNSTRPSGSGGYASARRASYSAPNARCVVRGERRHERHEPRALRPRGHRMVAAVALRQHLQVLGRPDVERARGGRQPAEVVGGRRDGRVAHERAELRAPARTLREVGDRRVRRRAKIVGHLHGERAARGHHRDHAREHRVVRGQPVQRRVRIHDVDRRVRRPRREIAGREAHARQVRGGRARLREHLRRVVHADDVRVRPALREEARDVARAAAQVDDRARRRLRDAREEIDRRAQPVVLELQVLLRIPGHDRILVVGARGTTSARARTPAASPAAARRAASRGTP